jgi:hypothetical protein
MRWKSHVIHKKLNGEEQESDGSAADIRINWQIALNLTLQ